MTLKRIVQVVNTFSRSDGGPARHALEVNFALNAAGTSVQLLSVHQEREDSLLREVSGRPDFPREAPRVIRSQPGVIRNLLGVARADQLIVHGYYLWWIPPLVAFATFCRVRTVVMPHGSLTAYDRGNSRLKKFVFRYAWGSWFVDRVSAFAVASPMEKEELPHSIPRRRVAVVGAGAGNMTRPVDVRGAVHDPVRLLALSRIAEKKRVDIAIASVKVLRDSGVNAVLTVAGSGADDQVSRLRELAIEAGVGDQVRFVGEVGGTAKQELLSHSDVFVLPSDDENFGLAFAEATMAAIPAVVSDRVGAAWALPEAAGVRLSAPTAESVAAAVIEILSRYETARHATREFGEREFLWSIVAQRWLWVLAQGRELPSAPGQSGKEQT